MTLLAACEVGTKIDGHVSEHALLVRLFDALF